jgi:glutamate racemase
MKPGCIGVFDSGVGGLSVLRALHGQWPRAPLLYVADSGHAPYGERSPAHVLARSRRIMVHLRAEGAAGMVIACNTATAIAVQALRAQCPDFPIVGVEPGLKPAAAATRNGRIGVMATPGTLSSDRFARLAASQAQGVVVVPRPCPGLARLIEAGDLQAPELLDHIEAHAAALRAAGVDTVVLGCTHYAFVRAQIQSAMGPQVHVVDTAEAVARHAVRSLQGRVAESDAPARLHTTGDPERLRAIAATWLPFECTVAAVAAEADAA